MKLHIRRNQKTQTSILGGHKGIIFILQCKVELASEEHALIDKYQAWHHALTYKVTGTPNPFSSNVDVSRGVSEGFTIGDLVRGINFEAKDVKTLMKNEETIKSACGNLKTILAVMSSFGGEEIIEF